MYTDRKGYRFEARRIRLSHGCILRLYNGVTTDMAKVSRKVHDLGCSVRLSFTDESLEKQKVLVASYRNLLDCGEALHKQEENTTTGHLLRGIE